MIDALATPARPSAASVAAELAALQQLRRTDPRSYWLEQNQSRERELLDQLQEAKANPATRVAAKVGDGNAEAPPHASSELGKVEAELAEIRSLKTSDLKRYYSDAVQARELQLLEAKEQLQDQAGRQERLSATLAAVYDGVADVEAFSAGFDAVFQGLPETAQRAVQQELARAPESPVRLANAAAVERFASTPEGKAAVEIWGKDAPRRIAVVRDRLKTLGDAAPALWDWYENLSPAEAQAVLLGLARAAS